MVKFNSFIESILNNGEASDFKQKYDSRYDFMKVVAMVFIVMWHINQHSAILGGGGGGWSSIKQSLSISMIFMTFLGTSGQVAVTIFIIISSWFMADRESVKSRKIILLIVKTSIISTGVYAVVCGCGLIRFSLRSFVKELITPFCSQYWFITCYCIYYFCVPLLNYLFKQKSNSSLKSTCIMFTLVVPFYHAIIGGPFGDFIWFVYIHICVLCLKRYYELWNIRNVKRVTVSIIVFWYMALFTDLILVHGFSENLSDFLLKLLVYRSLPVFLISFGIFEVCRCWNHSFSSFWTRLATYTVPIYICHENFVWHDGQIGSLLWNGIFNIEKYYFSALFPIYILLIVGIVFCVGILAGRIADLVILPFNYGITRFAEWCDSIFGKMYE